MGGDSFRKESSPGRCEAGQAGRRGLPGDLCTGELGLEGSMGSVGSSPTGAGASEVSYLKTDGA